MDTPRTYTGRGHDLIVEDLATMNLRATQTIHHTTADGRYQYTERHFDHPWIPGLVEWFDWTTKQFTYCSWIAY